MRRKVNLTQMKQVIKFSLLGMFSILIWSCRKIIDIGPKENTPTYVVEGKITNEPGVCKVLVSKTKNLTDNNQFEGISGAIVKIENNGTSTVLPETSKGVYEVSTIQGTPGQTYHLNVQVDGQTFTASSTMPELVPLIDAYIKSGDFDPQNTIVTVRYKDIPNVKNYYWFRKYVNDKNQKGYDLINDDFTPGTEVSERLSFGNETNDKVNDLKSGDRLKVEMACIDASVYTYLNSLYGAYGGGNNGAAPANPITNLSGGAQGFFSAHTLQAKTVTIP
jgi:hypothetical protein